MAAVRPARIRSPREAQVAANAPAGSRTAPATLGRAPDAAASARARLHRDARVAATREPDPAPAASPSPRDPSTTDRRLLEAWGATDREIEIALAFRGGQKALAIAAMLGISDRTVEKHLENLYRRVGVGGIRELAERLRREAARTRDGEPT